MCFKSSMSKNYGVREIIKVKLLDLEPNFNFNGMDDSVFKMCCKDFDSYVDYIKERRIQVTQSYEINDIDDDKRFVETWVEWWLSKYRKRVKLTFSDTPNDAKLSRGTNMMSKFSEEEIDDIKKTVKFKLIEGGEICGSTVLSNALFTRVLAQYSEKFEWNISAKLHLLNAILREANRMIHITGTLIFIKPAKESYGLREFRDDMGTVKA